MLKIKFSVVFGVLLGLLVQAAASPPPPGWADYRDIVQLAADGDRVYALRRNGNILLDDGSGVRVYDEGTGTKQITVERTTCYALKDKGNVWRRTGKGGWEKIDDGTGTKEIFAHAGGVYSHKDNSTLWEYSGAETGWQKIDDGRDTRQVAGDRGGNLYALKNNGNIWQYTKGSWYKIDDGKGTRQIQAARGSVYALKDNGNIWQYGDGWRKIDDGTGTRQMFSSGNDLFVFKNNGTTWQFAAQSWRKIPQDKADAVVISRGRHFVLRADGRITVSDAPK